MSEEKFQILFLTIKQVKTIHANQIKRFGGKERRHTG